MLSKNPVNPYKQVVKVTTMGFEPTRPYEHHPLKMASLPISPRGLKKNHPPMADDLL